MASNTENLDLLMKNPSTDGADTFNVQTMLNENWQKIDNNAGTVAQTLANILKPTTPPIIGLPPSTTPDGMFQALGNTGELHVWRKTVTTAQEIPAGYTLGASAAKTLAKSSENSGNSYATFYISSSISVDDAGNVTMNSPATVDIWQGIDAYDSDERAIFGKFIKFYSVSNSDAGITSDLETGIYFIPNSAEFTRYRDGKRSGYTNISACQKVDAYPLTPAGTTTTYPVSTNPKAYQEGDDAKPAGYTLGEVVTGSFRMSGTAPRNAYLYKYANSVAVKENGEVVLQNPETVNFNSDSHIGYESTVLSLVAGKFLYYYGRDSMADDSSAPDTQPPFNATPSEIVYVPTDAAITATNTYPAGFYLDKYQPVTGYPAIPAGTTIEYLGKLGDKARVQVVSYVGTGTYGESNPNSLTFDFVPKVVMFLYRQNFIDGYYSRFMQDATSYFTSNRDNVISNTLSTEYKQKDGFGYVSTAQHGKISEDKRTIYWYNNNQDTQANSQGYTYYYLGIG